MKWLDLYGSLDGVIAHAQDIGGVVGENLRQALDWLPQARVLVTVKTDCDLSTHSLGILDSLSGRAEDIPAMIDFYTRYGFKSWLRDAIEQQEKKSTVIYTNEASTLPPPLVMRLF